MKKVKGKSGTEKKIKRGKGGIAQTKVVPEETT
jgi:hypothetical protein